MKNLHITFTVQVSDREYTFQGRHASAEIKIQVPRQVLESINPGNLFVGTLQAALASYDAPPDESEE